MFAVNFSRFQLDEAVLWRQTKLAARSRARRLIASVSTWRRSRSSIASRLCLTYFFRLTSIAPGVARTKGVRHAFNSFWPSLRHNRHRPFLSLIGVVSRSFSPIVGNITHYCHKELRVRHAVGVSFVVSIARIIFYSWTSYCPVSSDSVSSGNWYFVRRFTVYAYNLMPLKQFQLTL